MFFLIFGTMYVPFGMIIVSLLGNWLIDSLRQVRAHAWRRHARARAIQWQDRTRRFSAVTGGFADRQSA